MTAPSPTDQHESEGVAKRRRPSRTVLVIAGLAALVILALVAAVVVRGSSRGSRILDAADTAHEIDLLADGRGFIAAPPVMGPGALDSSAWASLFFRAIGESPVHVSPAIARGAASSGDDPVWDAFYERSLGAGRPSATPVVAQLRHSASVDTSDLNAVATSVLRIWAGVRTLGTARIRSTDRGMLAAWLSARLQNCDANAFVGYYAQSTLAALVPASRSAWAREFGRCGFDAMPAAAVPPTNEVELLTAFAAAEWRARVPASSSVRRDQQVLRAMLTPQGSMAYDPWWSYYSAAGFVAAGGNGQAYADIARIMRSHAAASGLVPESTLPVSNIDTTYDSVTILTDLGSAAPRSLRAGTLGNPATLMEGQVWTDDQWAEWGMVMADLDVQPTAGPRAQLEAHVAACLDETVGPSTAHQVGICQATAERYGWSSRSIVDWSRWTGGSRASLLDAIASLQRSPRRAVATRSIRWVIAHPAAQSTIALADAVLAARVVGLPLTNDQKHAVRAALTARTAPVPFAGFERDSSDDMNPSLDATELVAAMDRWDLLADS